MNLWPFSTPERRAADMNYSALVNKVHDDLLWQGVTESAYSRELERRQGRSTTNQGGTAAMSFGYDFKELAEGREPKPMTGMEVLKALAIFFGSVIGVCLLIGVACSLAGVPFDVRAG